MVDVDAQGGEQPLKGLGIGGCVCRGGLLGHGMRANDGFLYEHAIEAKWPLPVPTGNELQRQRMPVAVWQGHVPKNDPATGYNHAP